MIVGVFANFQKELSKEILDKIVSVLKNEKIDWVLMNEKNKDSVKVNFLITIGGDGTLLNVVEKVAKENLPVLGINCGRVGYLTEEVADNIHFAIKKIIDNDYFIEERHLVEAHFKDKIFYALNDICLARSTFNIIDLSLYIDEVFAQEYRSDGIIIATATGSTAYSLSAGGPIVEPQLGVMVVTPICPHSLSSRSLVLGDDRVVKIKSESDEVLVVSDGRVADTLKKGEYLECKISSKKLKLVRLKKKNFYEVLREKIKE
ncbi:ATP-NAD/AcoX kinase [Caldicellulosiruptor saccharolyticus DSM 8903]|uniref:NAD kinase n=1 Tax=Caldicellulosiruptor saccharolyticus (strain ATCC 43494 / DSM 8903 / Tp8T 6331) TaxID=351627 RepID=NADK_CALS8|nr:MULTISPECIES: NAD(+)/NADH kinase [Caldicellulosiruptor]A4XKP6.1 RecName: Full=NAD kinase; AltName: Full=ATP-dependent NAD kinase [Caldicellulosiruptor saccharolyticus DSM 8903]ABP67481.1 ATP-NAD/AcoX kinase [Caldicellulosiruptor saccharolyticus DSM 8903]